jgi:hypothetical protein
MSSLQYIKIGRNVNMGMLRCKTLEGQRPTVLRNYNPQPYKTGFSAETEKPVFISLV